MHFCTSHQQTLASQVQSQWKPLAMVENGDAPQLFTGTQDAPFETSSLRLPYLPPRLLLCRFLLLNHRQFRTWKRSTIQQVGYCKLQQLTFCAEEVGRFLPSPCDVTTDSVQSERCRPHLQRPWSAPKLHAILSALIPQVRAAPLGTSQQSLPWQNSTTGG